MTTRNVSFTDSINNLYEQINDIRQKLRASLLDEIEKIALLPILDKMSVEIQDQTRRLETRLSILDSAPSTQDHMQLASIEKSKSAWEEVYQSCNKTEIAITTNEQTSLEITNEHYRALKEIQEELHLLNANPHLNEQEKCTIKNYLPYIEKLLFSFDRQITKTDLAEPIVIIDNPFVQQIQGPATNGGGFGLCPKEILLELFSYLSIKDLANLSRCSKFFSNTCADAAIWKKILHQEFPFVRIPDNKSAQETYISQKKIIKGLENGLYTCSTLIKSMNAFVHCVQKDGNFIFSAETEITIRNLTDLKSIECNDHKASVLCFQKHGHFLFSGSRDKTIKIWDLIDLNKIQCISTLNLQGGVQCLQIQGNLLFSGCANATIQVWDLTNLKSIQCIETLTGHQNVVRCLHKEDNLLFSASEDNTIKIWDLTNLKNIRCIATLIGHEKTIYCLLKKDNLLFSGSYDKTIKVWDINKNRCIATLQGHRDSVISLQMEGNRLVSGARDGSVNIWDLNTSSEDTLLNLIYMFKDISNSDHKMFLDRIKELPSLLRNEIYEALNEIQTFKKDYFECAEHSFLETNELHSTFEKKTEAIHRYLLKKVIELFKKDEPEKALTLFNKLPEKIKNPIHKNNNLVNNDKHSWIWVLEEFLNKTNIKK